MQVLLNSAISSCLEYLLSLTLLKENNLSSGFI
nr:MAG TPA: hypothetical protein [Bacteriophage sp.]